MSTPSSDEKLTAVLQSATAPTDTQHSRLLAFLKRTYGREAELTWEREDSLEKGFRLKVGSDVSIGAWRAACASSRRECSSWSPARRISFP